MTSPRKNRPVRDVGFALPVTDLDSPMVRYTGSSFRFLRPTTFARRRLIRRSARRRKVFAPGQIETTLYRSVFTNTLAPGNGTPRSGRAEPFFGLQSRRKEAHAPVGEERRVPFLGLRLGKVIPLRFYTSEFMTRADLIKWAGIAKGEDPP